jgi:hypothetical protein
MPATLSSSAPTSLFEIRDFRLTPQINLARLNFGLKFFGLYDCCRGLISLLGCGESFRKKLSYKQPLDFTQKTNLYAQSKI